MMLDRRLLLAVTLTPILAAQATLGQGSMTVPLPDLSDMSRAEAETLMHELAEINVITSNCPGFDITDGEWTLITGTGDRLASRLGIDPSTYDRDYYGPAFALLDDPTACDRIGPQARPLIRRLIRMGGGTEVTR